MKRLLCEFEGKTVAMVLGSPDRAGFCEYFYLVFEDHTSVLVGSDRKQRMLVTPVERVDRPLPRRSSRVPLSHPDVALR